MDDAQVMAAVRAVEGWMIDCRRALHQVPELGFELTQTRAYVRDRLHELRIPHADCQGGLLGLIEGARPGPTLLLRADMDALPLEEPSGPFSSRHPGRMHACGHDAHTAILLGAAKVLGEHRDALCGNVKLLFQPAEETDGGAKPMVEAGCMTEPPVDWAFGLHVMPRLPVGVVETRAGTLNAATDSLTIRIHGKSGHGAYPEGGADAIVCAAQLISALQTLISRNVSPLSSAVLHIGMIEGGAAPNVMCDLVTLRGTLRTADGALRLALKQRIREAVQGVCQAMGCTADVAVEPGYCALVNQANEAGRVLKLAERLYGAQGALEAAAPSMGGEDFAYFIERTPGAFFHVGCADPAHMPAPPLHSRAFTLDERCLAVGATMEVALAMELIGTKRSDD